MDSVSNYLTDRLELDKQRGYVIREGKDKIILYDIAKWDYGVTHDVLEKFPNSQISFEMNEHSLSGFIVIIHKPSCFWPHVRDVGLYLVLILTVLFLLRVL